MVSEGHVPLLLSAFEKAICASFDTDDPPMRAPTSYEVDRRFRVALEIVKALRGDYKWSVQRIADKLPGFLRMSLDGVDWEKHAEVQRMWTPDAPGAKFRGNLRLS